MKKLIPFLLISVFVTTLAMAVGRRGDTPQPRCIGPKNEAIVDLTGKESLLFSWKSNPVPSGGRMAYKFDLYKDYGYEVVESEQLDAKVFSIEVPADKFENGALYTWQVKQRDYHTRIWSRDYRWSFTVKK